MRAELFSLRREAKEVNELELHKKAIYQKLDEDTNAHIIVKTEVDRNPKRISEAFANSTDGGDMSECYIFANAIDTEDCSSFADLFTPLVALLEDAIDCSKPFKQDDKTLEKHINVYTFKCKGTDIKGYCFYALDRRFIFLPAFSLVSDISLPDFIAEGVNSANKVIDEKIKDYPDGTITLDKSEVVYLKNKGGFKSFLMSFIPYKGDSLTNIIVKLIVLIAIGTFIAGGVILFKFYVLDPMSNNSVIDEIQSIFYATPDEQQVLYATTDEGVVETIVVENTSKNWVGLKKANEEIVAWVKLDGTRIDYPVLEHKGDNADSQYYLYRNYKKEYSDFGSIFVDYRCLDSVDSKNLILHGHNMGSDDSMFGQLMNYARKDGRTQGNPEFYKDAPIITIDTPKGTSEYIIFSVMKIDVSNKLDHIFDYLKADFDSDARFMNFIYNLKVRSYLDVDVPINENDTLLTLSTCSYETENMRTVVVARQVREDENVKKYIKTAESASPVTMASSSFSKEYENNNISWYDGKGKLEGDEEIEYMTQSEMFTVKFLNAKGKTISEQLVIEGKDAKPPENDPRKAADGKYYYVFKGWDKSYKKVTKDLTIKPVFEKKNMPTATEETTTEPTTVATEAPYIPPQTQAPIVTEPPETEAPTTQKPATQAPATQAPATQAPTTAKPTDPPEPETTAAVATVAATAAQASDPAQAQSTP